MGGSWRPAALELRELDLRAQRGGAPRQAQRALARCLRGGGRPRAASARAPARRGRDDGRDRGGRARDYDRMITAPITPSTMKVTLRTMPATASPLPPRPGRALMSLRAITPRMRPPTPR